jgi:Trypsin
VVSHIHTLRPASLVELVLCVVTLTSCATHTTERSSAIVGGMEDRRHDAVVALVATPLSCGEPETVVCSGTVIAPRVVLTAAHCIESLALAPGEVVIGASTRSAAARRIRIVETVVDPAWNAPAHDLALVLLAEDAGVVPVRTADATVSIGGLVELVGYGLDDGEQTGTRRAGTARVAEISATHVRVRPEPALSCTGDSGGPALAVLDEVERVVAVASYGDSTCRASATYSRLDIDLDTFVASVVARARDGTIPLSLPAADQCDVGCSVDSDCPTDWRCTGDRCSLYGLPPGAIGASCSIDSQCAPGGVCVAAGGCACYEPCDAAGGCGAARTPSGTASCGLAMALLFVIVRRARRRRGPRQPSRGSLADIYWCPPLPSARRLTARHREGVAMATYPGSVTVADRTMRDQRSSDEETEATVQERSDHASRRASAAWSRPRACARRWQATAARRIHRSLDLLGLNTKASTSRTSEEKQS